MRRAAWLVGLVAVTIGAFAAPAGAVGFRDVAPDGRAVVFNAEIPQVAADTDSFFDVYSWNRGAFELASVSPASESYGSYSKFVSDDGTRVLFETKDRAVAADTDSSVDLYERVGGVTKLVSTGPADTGQELAMDYAAASNDGTRVFFETTAALVAEDTDTLQDIYLRTADGTTTLVSTTPAGVSPAAHYLRGVSRNGLRVVEWTSEAMTVADDDSNADVYERFDGGIELISKSLVDTPPTGGGMWVLHVTPDAKSVVVETHERMTAGDQNDDLDLYQFSRGRTTLVTSRSDGVSPKCDELRAPPPVGTNRGIPCQPLVQGQTDDGSRVLFTSPKPLATKPGPLGLPVTTAAGGLLEKTASGATRLIDEEGVWGGKISPDGSRYITNTQAAHSSADTDDEFDLYRLENGQATLLTGTDDSSAGAFFDATPDLSRVFFDTFGRHDPADTDNRSDAYTNTPDGPRLAAVGPLQASSQGYGGVLGFSDSGDRWFVVTPLRLTADDTGSFDQDLYIRHADGTTKLLSP
jgi:hypothetical protein